MKEDDNFFSLFKESSENTRDFDFKQSGWDKLNNRLNEDRAKKRRRLLIILPWILLPCLLLFNALLFRQQKEANENIARLQKELSYRSQTKMGTIVKEKHIYTHDTVYVYVTNNTTTYKGVSSTSKENFITKTITDKSTATDNSSHPSILNNKSEKENLLVKISNDTLNNVSTSNKEINDNHLDHSNGLIKKKESDTAFIKTVDQIINDTNSVIKQNDTLVQNINENSDTIIKEKISMKERLNKIKFEYGIEAGGIFPKDRESVSQIGFNGGIGINALMSKRIHVFSSVNYGMVRVHTTKINQVPWVPFEPTPNSTYAFDNAKTNVSTLNFSVGFRYNLPIAKRANLLIDLGYGTHYIFPYKVIYEFKNNDPKQDLVVETKPNHTGFVPNDFLFGLGLSYNLNDKYKLYLLSHYRINRQSTIYKLPDYFGISLGLFF